MKWRFKKLYRNNSRKWQISDLERELSFRGIDINQIDFEDISEVLKRSSPEEAAQELENLYI